MIRPDRARATVVAAARPLPVVELPLEEARGLRLGTDVLATEPLPPVDRSAMDGFAVRAADLHEAPCELPLVGEIAAGLPADRPLEPGTCVRILTGAQVPDGADTVVPVEATSEQDPTLVRFRATPRPGQHILRRGEDAVPGDLLLPAGTRLGPAQISLLASLGVSPVPVHPRVRVGVLCTGRELRLVEEPVAPHQVRDSNGPGLRAALAELGNVEVVSLAIAPDELEPLREAVVRALLMVDLLVLTGGASVGRYDLVAEALEAVGCTPIFSRVAQKPGKPTICARTPEGRLVFGLPGNPLAAFTSFHGFVRPALDVMAGGDGSDPSTWPVRLLEPVTGARRTRFVQVRLSGPAADGVWEAFPLPGASSADLVAAGRADGALIIAPGQSAQIGELVDFMPWRVRW
jgi:molybdopterin molybdotransferase